ncbi:hypothetical protein D3C71_1042970 [compost metagenome]
MTNAWAQQKSAQRGRECQGNNAGKRHGGGECHRKLAIQFADNSRQQRHWHEHRQQHQGSGNHRPGNLTQGVGRGLSAALPFCHQGFDAFDHHNRVVHHHRQRQNDCEQTQGIGGITQYVEHRKGADQRHRDRQRHNQRRAPALQEKRNNHYHGEQRQGQRGADLFDGRRDKLGGVELHFPGQVFRETRGQTLKLAAHGIGYAQGVGGRRRVDP